jgi:hypothetical protein
MPTCKYESGIEIQYCIEHCITLAGWGGRGVEKERDTTHTFDSYAWTLHRPIAGLSDYITPTSMCGFEIASVP